MQCVYVSFMYRDCSRNGPCVGLPSSMRLEEQHTPLDGLHSTVKVLTSFPRVESHIVPC